MESIPVFCGKDCGGNACPLLATVEDGVVRSVRDNPAGGPYLKGCRRGYRMPLELYAADRILTPLIATGPRGSGRFREAGWDEALDMVASGLARIRDEHGPGAVLELGSAGCTSALHGTGPLLSRFLNLFGGGTVLSGSYSAGAAGFILPYLFGPDCRRSGFDPATMRHSRMVILWGANVLEARLGTEVEARVVEAASRGVPVVVVDPRRSRTARRAGSWWIPCRPGTDSALMLAVLYVLSTEGLLERHFVDSHSTGFDRLERYVLGREGGVARTPGWAEAICGVSAAEIVRFARAYAAAKPAMLLPGLSIQRVYAGEEPFRLAVALQLGTGNFGRLGGSTGSQNNRLPGPRVGTLPVPPAPGQRTVPTVRWPDAVLEGGGARGPGSIRAIYNVGSNLLNQGADVAKSAMAFRAVEFAVCHELFLTPTARHCDVVLPVAHALEKEDIGLPWGGNFLTYKRRASVPRGEARCDYDIFRDLAARLGFEERFSEGRDAAGWIERFLEESEVPDPEELRSIGLYLAPDQERVGLAEFARDPAAHPLATPSGKVEVACERYYRETGFPAIPTWQEPPSEEGFPLRLITPKSPYRTHSQGSSLPEIRRLAAHALEMSAEDAAARGIHGGDRVRVCSPRGEVSVEARVSPDIAPGVVCLPEGVWVEVEGSGVDAAGSANVLTDTRGTAPAVACIMHGVSVEVRLEAGYALSPASPWARRPSGAG